MTILNIFPALILDSWFFSSLFFSDETSHHLPAVFLQPFCSPLGPGTYTFVQMSPFTLSDFDTVALHKHEHRREKKKKRTLSHCFSIAGNKCVSVYNKQKSHDENENSANENEWNEAVGPSWRAAACLECDICRRPGARARSSLICLHYAEGGWPDHERRDVPRSSLPKL